MSAKAEFQQNMIRLGKYFQVDITKEVVQAYYDQLYYIDADIFKRICDRLISDRKPFKSNFPVISQFGPLYESERPKKERNRPEFEGSECQECRGEGLLFYKFWSFKNGTVNTAHAACALCQNWRKHFNTLEPHEVRSGDGKFLYRFPGIDQTTKEQLCLKSGVLEVPEDGSFVLTDKELSDRILMFYEGGATNG